MKDENINSKNKISRTEKLNRLICARFLWNLYNGNKNSKPDLYKDVQYEN